LLKLSLVLTGLVGEIQNKLFTVFGSHKCEADPVTLLKGLQKKYTSIYNSEQFRPCLASPLVEALTLNVTLLQLKFVIIRKGVWPLDM
jgi:hypothetical protein